MKGETALKLVADYGCMHTHMDTYNDFAVAIQKNSSNIGHAPQEVSWIAELQQHILHH